MSHCPGLDISYVPALLTKEAHCAALRDTSHRARRWITPMFVVTPPAWSFDHDGPATAAAEHVAGLPARLAAAWTGGSAFVDTLFVSSGTGDGADGSVLERIVGEAAVLGLRLVPVTGPHHPRADDATLARLADEGGRGLCLRLGPDEWPTRIGPVQFRRLLERLRADPPRTDLVLDLGDMAADDEDAIATAVIYELAVLPFPEAWRTVTVIGCSIPLLLPIGVRRVRRREWEVYRRLAGELGLPRRPSFGDYGVMNPDPRAELDAIGDARLTTLLHTVGADTAIARGHLAQPMLRRSGTRSIPPTSHWVRSHPDFAAGHCEFEVAVQAAASALRHDAGDRGDWRRMALRHHLEVVAEQLASLAGVDP